MKNSLFNSGKYYDLFYKDKDYEAEAKSVHQKLIEKKATGKRLLELGWKPSIDLDISIITNDLSSLYSGGASKDPNLSIGGGPGKYDTAKAINAAKQLLTKLL